MNQLEVTMLVTVMTNYDCVPKMIDIKGEKHASDVVLARVKEGQRWALYALNNEVIRRRGKLLRK